MGHIIFLLVFVVSVILISIYGNSEISPFLLAALSFAAFRGGRAISFNPIFEWLRAPFTRVVKDSSGAGDSVEPYSNDLSDPEDKNWHYAIGELLCCPICTGTWVATILYGLYTFVPNLGTTLIYILAAAGIAEQLHWWAEKNEWQGRASREDAGTAWLAKNTISSEKIDGRNGVAKERLDRNVVENMIRDMLRGG